ncbi:Uncharacterized protein APZ42_016849 [Daphnia magna]|uniref:Uncharacterized protein n=1 Tax=Daphnia magna TaxID=35525 RepID=A0A165A745_9CRUS|nr:Uncharacterized protein APZ42_016849 [Daphnia magna]
MKGNERNDKNQSHIHSERVKRHGAHGTDCVGVAGESLSTLAFHEAKFFDAGALCRVRTLMGG